MVNVDAVFRFVADSPVTALIIGGILFLLLAGLFAMVGSGIAVYFVLVGFVLLFIGIALYTRND